MFFQYMQKILSGVNPFLPTLEVPGSNLQEELLLQFKLTVSGMGITANQDIFVYTRDYQVPVTLEEFGVNPSLIYVDPISGTSGETQFTAYFNFDSRNFFSSSNLNWTFSIEISEYNLVYTTRETKGKLEFFVPTNSTGDKEVTVLYSARSGSSKYTATRKVLAKKNAKASGTLEEKLQTLPLLNNITNSSTNASSTSLNEFQVLQAS